VHLYQNKASINETILRLYRQASTQGAIDEFLLYGADISLINKKGQIFFYLIILNWFIETRRVLLSKRILVSIRDIKGSIVLYLRADQG
jgi:hypothetical protein